ncbi:DNA processing protein [Bacillus thermophilus]|uniref:DNA processing protein n=1 Tax=Siminovitchia thermophila TaxID=1245522 RepID=A0ABS2R8Z0_9BACI|nr:DNA-processing protein DprA [Siminovitchia thermophila]MBM7715654.1 DNA processing protein [Siminovitchia thermophila]ONK23250.1 DNA protecting protein DprA [Bacillus sp. VT-16-64]
MVFIFKERLLHLLHCQLPNGSIRHLLELDPDLSQLYSISFSTLQSLLHLDPSSKKRFSEQFYTMDMNKLLSLYHSNNIAVITYRDEEYPEQLKEVYDPPLVLFARGDTALLKRPSLAIVGARKADDYAKRSIRLLLPPLLQKGFIIISGLARGTDSIAHQQTMMMGGKTIGVLGGGFFHLYPPENKTLAEEMSKHHLLLSEYPPIWKPKKWFFPMRNRIISGLAKGTVIIQANIKSGSLITADFALDEGREVFAVPGPIDSPLSEGTNRLIKQGAKLVSSGEDILEELLF